MLIYHLDEVNMGFKLKSNTFIEYSSLKGYHYEHESGLSLIYVEDAN